MNYLEIDSALGLARLASDEKRYNDSSMILKNILRNGNLSKEYLIQIGEIAQASFEYTIAIESLYLALIQDSRNIYINFELCKCLIELNRISEALVPLAIIKEQNISYWNVINSLMLLKSGEIEFAARSIHPSLSAFKTGSYCDILFIKCLQKIESPTLEKNIKVPRIILQYWDKNIPDDVLNATKCYSSLEEFHYVMHNKESAIAFIESNYGSNLRDIFLRCTHPAMEADVFRLMFLHYNGGYYFDTDELLIDGKTAIFNVCESEPYSSFLWQVQTGLINNAVLAVTQQHPIMELAINQVVENILKNNQDGIWSVTGPGVLTRATANYMYRCLFHGNKHHGVRFFSDSEMEKFVWHTGFEYENDERSWQRFEASQN